MEDTTRKELKDWIQNAGYELYNAQMVAKENLDDLLKGWAEKSSIKKSVLLKMVKIYWDESKLDDERNKLDEFESLYEEVLKG